MTANARNVRKLVPTCSVCHAHYLWHTNHPIFSFDSGVCFKDRVFMHGQFSVRGAGLTVLPYILIFSFSNKGFRGVA